MSLDMYLEKDIYTGVEYKHLHITGKIEIEWDGIPIPINFNRVLKITERIGHWRNANAIHNWFVENVQYGQDDCHRYLVSDEQLQELLNICEQIKDKCVLVDGVIAAGKESTGDGQTTNLKQDKMISNPELASKLLPVGFFDAADYDEDYYQQVIETIKILKEALKDNTGSFYYQSSW